tara:strand:- start:371 stop:1342 length:972 start_codon:yes stop_codon:yes gene_type:complete
MGEATIASPIRMPSRQGENLTVAVAMATFNGRRFLLDQLESLATQTRLPDLLLVSDDGSTDDTRDIVLRFAETAPFAVHMLDGPCTGYGANFASLLERMPGHVDVVALSDQDDIWLPGKIQAAVDALAQIPKGPALYGGRSVETSETMVRRRLSRAPGIEPSFRHALARNIAGGNTMVLNRPAVDLMRHAASKLRADPVHDWWIYQIVTGCGGAVIFDDRPGILYRQHGGNQIGANGGFSACLARLRGMINGRYRDWTDANLANLHAVRDNLRPDCAQLLDQVTALRSLPLLTRVLAFARTGIHRDGRLGQAGMWASVLTGRF